LNGNGLGVKMIRGWTAGAAMVVVMVALAAVMAAWVRGGRVEPHSVEQPVTLPGTAAGHA
jgi:hypothetical protein